MGFVLFEKAACLDKLTRLGDPLERLDKVIPWEMFRPTLSAALNRTVSPKGGRPPYDVILMFKILILQRFYGLSDDQTEYQVNDRMSFKRFLGITLGGTVPDAKTIWHFREQLVKAKAIDECFNLFGQMLEDQGIITHKGSIVDATFVDAPKQRNSREDNAKIKNGEVPEEWKEPQNKNKLAQKDTDARWTKKNNETHYGYKNHVKVDADSKMITGSVTTPANVHDSQPLPELIDEKDRVLYADSAYSGKPVQDRLPAGLDCQIHEKGYKNHPLTDEQKASNRIKSSTRVRVEHVFGFMTNSMHGITLRCIGIARARFNCGITNLVYNLCRYEFLCSTRNVGA